MALRTGKRRVKVVFYPDSRPKMVELSISQLPGEKASKEISKRELRRILIAAAKRHIGGESQSAFRVYVWDEDETERVLLSQYGEGDRVALRELTGGTVIYIVPDYTPLFISQLTQLRDVIGQCEKSGRVTRYFFDLYLRESMRQEFRDFVLRTSGMHESFHVQHVDKHLDDFNTIILLARLSSSREIVAYIMVVILTPLPDFMAWDVTKFGNIAEILATFTLPEERDHDLSTVLRYEAMDMLLSVNDMFNIEYFVSQVVSPVSAYILIEKFGFESIYERPDREASKLVLRSDNSNAQRKILKELTFEYDPGNTMATFNCYAEVESPVFIAKMNAIERSLAECYSKIYTNSLSTRRVTVGTNRLGFACGGGCGKSTWLVESGSAKFLCRRCCEVVDQ